MCDLQYLNILLTYYVIRSSSGCNNYCNIEVVMNA